jgi:hypothetical protein
MSSFSNIVRFPVAGEPLFFERVPVNDRREIAIKEIDECLGGAMKLIEIADERRMEFHFDLSEFRLDEARDDLLKVLGQLAQIKDGAR